MKRLSLNTLSGPISINADLIRSYEKYTPIDEDDAGINVVIWFSETDATYVKETKEHIDGMIDNG